MSANTNKIDTAFDAESVAAIKDGIKDEFKGIKWEAESLLSPDSLEHFLFNEPSVAKIVEYLNKQRYAQKAAAERIATAFEKLDADKAALEALFIEKLIGIVKASDEQLNKTVSQYESYQKACTVIKNLNVPAKAATVISATDADAKNILDFLKSDLPPAAKARFFKENKAMLEPLLKNTGDFIKEVQTYLTTADAVIKKASEYLNPVASVVKAAVEPAETKKADTNPSSLAPEAAAEEFGKILDVIMKNHDYFSFDSAAHLNEIAYCFEKEGVDVIDGWFDGDLKDKDALDFYLKLTDEDAKTLCGEMLKIKLKKYCADNLEKLKDGLKDHGKDADQKRKNLLEGLVKEQELTAKSSALPLSPPKPKETNPEIKPQQQTQKVKLTSVTNQYTQLSQSSTGLRGNPNHTMVQNLSGDPKKTEEPKKTAGCYASGSVDDEAWSKITTKIKEIHKGETLTIGNDYIKIINTDITIKRHPDTVEVSTMKNPPDVASLVTDWKAVNSVLGLSECEIASSANPETTAALILKLKEEPNPAKALITNSKILEDLKASNSDTCKEAFRVYEEMQTQSHYKATH